MRLALLATLLAAAAAIPARLATRGELPAISPNDNRAPAGRLIRGALHVRLEARDGAWRPDPGVDSAVTVPAFAEVGRALSIPGPLIRAAAGTPVVVTLTNRLDSTLVVHGLRGRTFRTDTITLAPGQTREVRFVAGAPGTYMYWGTTTGSWISGATSRSLRDSQLTGAMVVDPPAAAVDTAERIFVITLIDVYKSDTARNRRGEEIWEVAINGRSWPHTERLAYQVGRTVRWRWVNGSDRFHPMHLHGFHFSVTAKGDTNVATTYAPRDRRLAVTEFMRAGSTFSMEFVPTRAGRWLMHCHMIPHITPFPERADTAHMAELHDMQRHPLDGMAGLVLGITTTDTAAQASTEPPPPSPPPPPAPGEARRLRLFAQRRVTGGTQPAAHGYVLQRGDEPAPDSVEVPGTPIVLTRGARALITVVNRLGRPTTVHWHGMELESVFDGVAGWSATGSAMAPLVAPGDSFTVAFTPPRAGTYIYHTHMDEGPQILSGMYGPLIVLEPGQRHDPEHDLVFVLGGAVEKDSLVIAVNGRREQPSRVLRAGETYRLRFINMHFADPVEVRLSADSEILSWRAVAKDGADLPPHAARVVPAVHPSIGVGETYDFAFTPQRPMRAVLEFHLGGERLVRRFDVQP